MPSPQYREKPQSTEQSAAPASVEGSLPSAHGPRRDVYSQITEQIIADLEKGVRPWAKPWNAEHAAGPIMRPLRHNGLPYSGINVLMLWMSATSNNYAAPIWMTFRQVKELGGFVKPGSKSTLVVYSDHYDRTEKAEDGEETKRQVWFMRGYHVFNVEQTEGLPGHYYALRQGPKLDPARRIERAEAFFRNLGADIRHGGNSAHYSPSSDHIQMPPFESFSDPAAYYSTLGHESVHWTKHEKRLARDFGKKAFGDEGYAKEELVAELGAAFLCSDLSLVPIIRDDHAAYLGHWLKVLKADKRFIVTAATHAQKAVDYLHGLQPKEARSSDATPPEESPRPTVVLPEVLPPPPTAGEPAAPVVAVPSAEPASPPVAALPPEPAPAVESLLTVSVNSKTFLERFRAVSLFAARKSQAPLLETVRLEVTPEGRAWLHARNFDSGCSLAVPVMKLSSPGAVQLSRDQVVKALKDAKGGAVSFEALAPEGPAADARTPSRKFTVRTAQGSVTFASFDPGHFGLRTPESVLSSVELPAWKLLQALARTVYGCDPYSTRFALGGVCLTSSDGTLVATGTDGRCLAVAEETAAGSGLEAPKSIKVGEEERPVAPVIPLPAVKGLIEVLSVLEPNRKLTLGFTPEGWFQLHGDGLAMSARLLEGRFPDWQDVLPPESPRSARVDPRLLEQAVRKLAGLTTFEAPDIRVTLRGSTLTLTVANASASSSGTVPVQNLSADPDEAATVSIGPDRLLPYLAAQRSTFVLRFPPGDEWPLLCESPGFRFLLMPMKKE
ncbi:MAG: zincin-like metallopeptidase domain-containing protein [Isosphaeraceae bacterium]